MAGSLDYREYELVVRNALERRINEDFPGGNVQVFHDRTFLGQSGQTHQIDLSAEVTLAGISILILVECKHYKRRLGSDDVLVFLGRIRDIGAHKGIMATSVGYQEGAMRIADSHGIALVVTTVEEESWRVVLPSLE